MPFFRSNKSSKALDFFGAIAFISIGWLSFFTLNEEVNVSNPKSGVFLILQGLSESIGKWPVVIVLNLIGLLLLLKGLKRK